MVLVILYHKYNYQSTSQNILLTHLCLASHNRDIGKQYSSGSTLFAFITGITRISIKHSKNRENNQTPFLLEMYLSK